VEQLLPSATPLELHNALFVSSREGHAPVVATLLRHTKPGTVHEALLVAAAGSGSGQQPVVELLLTRATPADASAALRVAAKGGHLGIVQLLVAAGADVTVEGNAAVALADAMHHEGVVQYLVERGADLTIGRFNQSAIRFWQGVGQGLNRLRFTAGVLGFILLPWLVMLKSRENPLGNPKLTESEEGSLVALLWGWFCSYLLLMAVASLVAARLMVLRGGCQARRRCLREGC
jgi:hypothetical protein